MSDMEQIREQLVNDLINIIKSKMPSDAHNLCEFASQYLANVAIDDLLGHKQADLYGIILSHWNLLQEREPGQTKVRVYNPHQEQHGWQSVHTIVEVITDDMPFLVDSLRMEINRMGFNIHFIIHRGGLLVKRNDKNKVQRLLSTTDEAKQYSIEAPIYIEIDRQTDNFILEQLRTNLLRVLSDVRGAVDDWSSMQECIKQKIIELEHSALHIDTEEVAESIEFLRRMVDDHFTFLGIREYKIIGNGEKLSLQSNPQSGLGILRETSANAAVASGTILTPEARELLFSNQILIISKADQLSTVHRPVYLDSISVKRFDQHGKVIGELRILGLYTSVVYNSNPRHIPFLRKKVAEVMIRSKLNPRGHAGKALLNIMETFPRDDLFQVTGDELYQLAMGILHLQERRKIKLFARRDAYHRFVSCLVYVPREQFNTDLRESFEQVLKESFNAVEISFSPYFSDSVLAQIHFVVRVNPELPLEYDVQAIEKRLIAIAKTWKEELSEAILDHFGEEQGNALIQEYSRSFPASYRDDFLPQSAVCDIEHIEVISSNSPLSMSFYQPLHHVGQSQLRFKLFHLDQTLPLSDVLPMLENMGLRVLGERPYRIATPAGKVAWINDFGMVLATGQEINVEERKDNFHEAFRHVWSDEMENDGFNRLVLSAGMNWREVSLFRAYAKYLRQIRFTFSFNYLEETICKHAPIAKMLLQLFTKRFDPKLKENEVECQQLEEQILQSLETVSVLDEDRIIRRFLDVIKATIRTNFFLTDADGKCKQYISFKIASSQVPEMPLPHPMYEIFVYSPRFEGIHLRGAKVARGGLRWSDRREDFRTEVLGLMKAQSVKNAVIVPAGAKGGFVPKCLPTEGTREALMDEVIKCYQNFLRGLLDITDNLINGEIEHPKNVRCYDDFDHYLVVAADKGTATFSDIANGVSQEYNFWLGDAFASGGSAGYDHKKMGITARGAWVSVQRHFRELGIDADTANITVVGIGDMAGDVFGNGLLCSKHCKLIAAFNHAHIFIDPSPDPDKSYLERVRLFNTPRTTWEDYDPKLISAGGGVFKRSVKSIRLTPEINALLGINVETIVPNELIRLLLQAKVDLLWNGGIGTYVKSSAESDVDVGDKANDSLRVNGHELACRVVAEGGNLGFTQLGRIEYALAGGKINTDFIDNSAGVDCSDHEVNIKILLNNLVTNGDLTVKQRNQLLAQMQDEVGQLVLDDNYQQTLALSVAEGRALGYVELHGRLLQELERRGKLNTKLEFLPSQKMLFERKSKGRGLTRPELAVLLAYTKSILKESILKSEVPEDRYLSQFVTSAFPNTLREQYPEPLANHTLRREIIATQLSNLLINEMGITFTHRLNDETGAPIAVIVRAYMVVRELFGLTRVWEMIQGLDVKVTATVQYDMLVEISRLARRCTRWFLRNRRIQMDVENTIREFTPGLETLRKNLLALSTGVDRESLAVRVDEYREHGVPDDIAQEVAKMGMLFSALDIIQAASRYSVDIVNVAKMYFCVGKVLELDWFRAQLTKKPVESRWDALMREALRDDLDWQQRDLSIAVLYHYIESDDIQVKIDQWRKSHRGLVQRWGRMLEDLRSRSVLDFNMFSVAVRELLDLAQTSVHNPRVAKNMPLLSQRGALNRQTDPSENNSHSAEDTSSETENYGSRLKKAKAKSKVTRNAGSSHTSAS